jgi:hypothetical protein
VGVIVFLGWEVLQKRKRRQRSSYREQVRLD